MKTMTASILIRFACAASPLLLGGALVGCIVDPQGNSTEETVNETTAPLLAGWVSSAWGTTMDTVGHDTGLSIYSWGCGLSGIAGNLTGGGTFNNAVQAEASVADTSPFTGRAWLKAHGGAISFNGATVWLGNPVIASATCFPTVASEPQSWTSRPSVEAIAPPRKLVDLFAPAGSTRQCFLSGVRANDWSISGYFARVVARNADATHLTAGWYLESNLVDAPDGSHQKIFGVCMDLPSAIVASVSATSAAGSSNTVNVATGTGVKACGLTSISGAFNTDSYSDGVLIQPPDTTTGTWTMTVTNGKSGTAACIR